MVDQSAYTLRPLSPADAAAGAALHVAGQPGTFLTRLGLPFLRVLYRGMARSRSGFGTVAVREPGRVVGVVVGTDSTGALFRELIGGRWWQFVLPVGLGILRDLSLLRLIRQTFSYPEAEACEPGIGELLFIGVDPQARRSGIGSALVDSLFAAARQRGLRGLTVTVDAENATAIRFYERHGFAFRRTAPLYGRPMHHYRITLCENWEDDHRRGAENAE